MKSSKFPLFIALVICFYVLAHLLYEGQFIEAFFPTGLLVFFILAFVIRKLFRGNKKVSDDKM